MTTTAAVLVPDDTPAKGHETVPLARRMRDGYLAAAMFDLGRLAEVTREAKLLGDRGSVLNYERAVVSRDELQAWVDRYKNIAQLLLDEGLVQDD